MLSLFAGNNEFAGLSTRASNLLAREEGLDVEFKQNLNGLHAEDLVAFANSKYGGAILIGVKEEKKDNGRQKGEIIGNPVGDEEKLTILNKAESCHPPVYLEVYIENSNTTPFYRLEVPSGKDKPYCTSSGTYKIRGDGRTNVLFPYQLLSLFVEVESDKFIDRFKEATKELEKSQNELKANISQEMKQFLSNIQVVEDKLNYALNHLSGNLNTLNKNDKSEHQSVSERDQMFENLTHLEKRIDHIDDKLDYILQLYDNTYKDRQDAESKTNERDD